LGFFFFLKEAIDSVAYVVSWLTDDMEIIYVAVYSEQFDTDDNHARLTIINNHGAF
jgi:hypothetical protein